MSGDNHNQAGQTCGFDLDLDAVVSRYSQWHGAANESPDGASGWPLADYGETMSHYIVREDVPALVAEVRRLRAEREGCGHPNHGGPNHDCTPFRGEVSS